MKLTLYIAALSIICLSACKKDETPEPVVKNTPTKAESRYAQCINTSIDNTKRPMNDYSSVIGTDILEYFTKFTWNNNKNNLNFFQIDDSTWSHYKGESASGSIYSIEHYNKDEQLIHSENYKGSILISKTEYEYTKGFKTESGREYYLPKSIMTTAIDNNIKDYGYLYYYTGNDLDSILYADTKETYIRYEKKTNNIRKAIITHRMVPPGSRFFEEHLNEFGRVIKIEAFQTYGSKSLGYVLYNYDCK